MATVYKAVYSKTFLITAGGSNSHWIHWGGTGGDSSPFRDMLPQWVSGGAPGDPYPVAIVEWKGIGFVGSGASIKEVVSVKVRNRSKGTIGVRFTLIKILN